ncbi:MAG: DUF5060 domain-containing protein, partial [Thermomicrobiales bacterium]
MDDGTRDRFSAATPLFALLRHPQGGAVVDRYLPGLTRSAELHTLHGFAVGLVAATDDALARDPARHDAFLAEVAALDPAAERRTPAREAAVVPSPAYEDAGIAAGSAAWNATTVVPCYGRFELELRGPSHGNPFVEVAIAAWIAGPDGTVRVPGFYDGDGVFCVRYMPECSGDYTWTTISNARSLDGIAGTFTVMPPLPGAHGPVRVADTFHFAHADGTRHRPLGTTAYAWTHQGDALEEKTLATLATSPFTKIRMCVFPKSYLYNENEPEHFPFEGDLAQGFDLQRFNVASWRHLERRIAQLADLGIEADLILFHPYDRWGFSTMDPVADDRYLAYAVARLASFANVWWSLANEYDLLFAKTEADWERFAAIVQRDDPSRHLLSIHNCRPFYDHSRPWVT